MPLRLDLTRSSSSPVSSPRQVPNKFAHPAPVTSTSTAPALGRTFGIARSYQNCALISLVQLLAHSQAVVKFVEEEKIHLGSPVGPGLRDVLMTLIGRKTPIVSIKELTLALESEHGLLKNEQHDPIDVAYVMFGATGLDDVVTHHRSRVTESPCGVSCTERERVESVVIGTESRISAGLKGLEEVERVQVRCDCGTCTYKDRREVPVTSPELLLVTRQVCPHGVKVKAPVEIEYEISYATASFRLVGFLTHEGCTAGSGHYRAVVPEDDHFVVFDDHFVSEVANVDDAPGTPSFFIYEKVHKSTSSTSPPQLTSSAPTSAKAAASASYAAVVKGATHFGFGIKKASVTAPALSDVMKIPSSHNPTTSTSTSSVTKPARSSSSTAKYSSSAAKYASVSPPLSLPQKPNQKAKKKNTQAVGTGQKEANGGSRKGDGIGEEGKMENGVGQKEAASGIKKTERVGMMEERVGTSGRRERDGERKRSTTTLINSRATSSTRSESKGSAKLLTVEGVVPASAVSSSSIPPAGASSRTASSRQAPRLLVPDTQPDEVVPEERTTFSSAGRHLPHTDDRSPTPTCDKKGWTNDEYRSSSDEESSSSSDEDPEEVRSPLSLLSRGRKGGRMKEQKDVEEVEEPFGEGEEDSDEEEDVPDPEVHSTSSYEESDSSSTSSSSSAGEEEDELPSTALILPKGRRRTVRGKSKAAKEKTREGELQAKKTTPFTAPTQSYVLPPSSSKCGARPLKPAPPPSKPAAPPAEPAAPPAEPAPSSSKSACPSSKPAAPPSKPASSSSKPAPPSIPTNHSPAASKTDSPSSRKDDSTPPSSDSDLEILDPATVYSAEREERKGNKSRGRIVEEEDTEMADGEEEDGRDEDRDVNMRETEGKEEKKERASPVVVVMTRVTSSGNPAHEDGAAAVAEDARNRILELGLAGRNECILTGIRFGAATDAPAMFAWHGTVRLRDQPLWVLNELLRRGGRLILQGLTALTCDLAAFSAFLDAVPAGTTVVILGEDDSVHQFAASDLVVAAGTVATRFSASRAVVEDDHQTSRAAVEHLANMAMLRRELEGEESSTNSAMDMALRLLSEDLRRKIGGVLERIAVLKSQEEERARDSKRWGQKRRKLTEILEDAPPVVLTPENPLGRNVDTNIPYRIKRKMPESQPFIRSTASERREFGKWECDLCGAGGFNGVARDRHGKGDSCGRWQELERKVKAGGGKAEDVAAAAAAKKAALGAAAGSRGRGIEQERKAFGVPLSPRRLGRRAAPKPPPPPPAPPPSHRPSLPPPPPPPKANAKSSSGALLSIPLASNSIPPPPAASKLPPSIAPPFPPPSADASVTPQLPSTVKPEPSAPKVSPPKPAIQLPPEGPVPLPPPRPDGRYECPRCSKNYINPTSFKKHLCHVGKKICPTCKALFTGRKAYVRHWTTVHSGSEEGQERIKKLDQMGNDAKQLKRRAEEDAEDASTGRPRRKRHLENQPPRVCSNPACRTTERGRQWWLTEEGACLCYSCGLRYRSKTTPQSVATSPPFIKFIPPDDAPRYARDKPRKRRTNAELEAARQKVGETAEGAGELEERAEEGEEGSDGMEEDS